MIENFDKLDTTKKKKVVQLVHQLKLIESRENLFKFTQTTFKKFRPQWFHKTFYDILNRTSKTNP